MLAPQNTDINVRAHLSSASMAQCERWHTDHPEDFTTTGAVVTHTENGQELHWDRTYSEDIKKIILHETHSDAFFDHNRDGHVDAADAAAKVRGILYDHTVTRGWGDIGYHFLIDRFGTIYEGKSGGPFVVGGHTFCANKQTIGIALLGKYKDIPMSADMHTSLTKLLGYISATYGIDPRAKTTWHGKHTRNLVGHRDYGYTADPPPAIYDALDTFADEGYAKRGWFVRTEKEFSGLLLTSPPPALSVGEESMFEVTMRNTGILPWPTGTTVHLHEPSAKAIAGGLSFSQKNGAVHTLEAPVAGGGALTFAVPITALSESGRYDIGFTINTKTPIVISGSVPVTVMDPHLSYTFVSATHPPSTITRGESAIALVKLKNTGNFNWQASGRERMRLVTAAGSAHAFTGSKEVAQLLTETAPGETATFLFTLRAPDTAGLYSFSFYPETVSGLSLPDVGMHFESRVLPPRFDATLAFNKQLDTLMPWQQTQVDLHVVNTGETTWTDKNFSLEISAPQVVSASIQPEGFPVPPGGTLNAQLFLQVNEEDATHDVLVQPRFLGESFGSPAPLTFEVASLPAVYAASFMSTPKDMQMPLYDTATIELTFKNTGTLPLRREGPGQVLLASSAAGVSPLSHNSWKSIEVPAYLTETQVLPGGMGTVRFTIGNNTQGTLHDSFQLVVAGQPISPSVSMSIVDATSLVASLLPTAHAAPTPSTQPVIRVKLSFESPTVRIAGGQFRLKNEIGDYFFTGTIADFDYRKLDDGAYIIAEPMGSTILSVDNWANHPGWTNAYNDNRFRGLLEVRRMGNTLVVINELPLEDYLRGVAEPLPSDPPEKARLLAILARSYALWYLSPEHRKFPGKPWDASDDPAQFQRYLGYSYEARGQMPEFAEATRGQVVAGPSGVVKTPYFSSSNGRTFTPAEAGWSAKEFWFVTSQKDPWSCGYNSNALDTFMHCPGTQRGHGVGISGAAMTGLAREGKTAEDIVEYFFDGVSIVPAYD